MATPHAQAHFMKVLLALILVLATGQTTHASRLFYTDQPSSPVGSSGWIMSIALDGSDQQILATVTTAPDLRGIAWHAGSKRIFFLDNGTAKAIFAMTANGGDLQRIRAVSADLLAADLEIEANTGKLYWAESNPGTTGNGLILRANLDGTGLETVVSTAPGSATTPYFLFLDSVAEYVYWGVLSSGNGPSTFQRATWTGLLDTSFLITTATRTRDLVVDPATATVMIDGGMRTSLTGLKSQPTWQPGISMTKMPAARNGPPKPRCCLRPGRWKPWSSPPVRLWPAPPASISGCA